MLEDHRPHSKAEGADRRADKGYTTAAGESSSFRSALYHMDAPARTGKAESISAPCRPTVCKLALFLIYKGWRYQRYQTVILTISASRSCSSALQEDTRQPSKKTRVSRLLCKEEELHVMRILSVHLSGGYISDPDT